MVPVVVSMSNVAGSGGYWITCGAQKIVAEPVTLTGSIGVFAGTPQHIGFLVGQARRDLRPDG